MRRFPLRLPLRRGLRLLRSRRAEAGAGRRRLRRRALETDTVLGGVRCGFFGVPDQVNAVVAVEDVHTQRIYVVYAAGQADMRLENADSLRE